MVIPGKGASAPFFFLDRRASLAKATSVRQFCGRRYLKAPGAITEVRTS
jgi:hypothetical protein